MRQGMRPRGERPHKQETIRTQPEEKITTDVQNGPPIFEMETKIATTESEAQSEAGVSGAEVPEKAFQGLPPEARINLPDLAAPKERSFAEQIAEDTARHNANLAAAEQEKTNAPEVQTAAQPTTDAIKTVSVQKTSSKSSSTRFSFKRLGKTIAGLFKRTERAQPPEPEAVVIDKEKQEAARALKIELPEKPSSEEIRKAILELVGRLPELQEIGGGMFKDGSPIMRSLQMIDANTGDRLGYYDPSAAFIDTRVMQDVLSEHSKELQEQYPERSEVYAQLNRLARSFGHINNQKTKRGQMVSNTDIAHGMLKDDVIRRLDYDLKYNPPDEVIYPSNGEVTFTDEERAAARDANPEVAELHEKMRLEAEVDEKYQGIAHVRIPREDRTMGKPIQESPAQVFNTEPGTLQSDGTITFSNAERIAAREQSPEIAKLHDEMQDMVGDDELGNEIESAFDAALKSHEESLPELQMDALEEIIEEPVELSAGDLEPLPEERIPGIGGMSETVPADALPRRVEHIVPLEKKGELVLKPQEGVLPAVKEVPRRKSVREKHGEVTQTTTMEQVRQNKADQVRAEIARIQEQITGKEKRLSTQLQWWKFGESNRISRKATKEAIVKLQEQLRAQQWALSDLVNASQMTTREEMLQLPKHERQKKKRFPIKKRDFDKRTNRRAS